MLVSGGYLLSLSLLARPAFAAVISKRETILKRDALPSYALTYAPLAYLYSGENYWPSDISTHLQHTTPEVGVRSALMIPLYSHYFPGRLCLHRLEPNRRNAKRDSHYRLLDLQG